MVLLPLDHNGKFPASVLPAGGPSGDYLKKNGAIQRENQRWDVDINIDEEYQYIIDWIDKRLGDLDSRL